MAIVTSSIRERTSAGEYRGASTGMVGVDDDVDADDDVDVDDDVDTSSSLIVCYYGDNSVLCSSML